VQRHIDDLNHTDYYFDEAAADRVIKLIKMLRHTSGSYARKHFDLQPFQAFGVAMIFGWKRKDTGKRRFTKAYWETPRKSGKSELAGAIELYMAFFDGENAGQVYTVATKLEQAKFCHEAAKSMANQLKKDSVSFKNRCKVTQYEIKDIMSNSYIKKLTADSGTNDGASPSLAVIDEYHAHKSSAMLKVIETGVGARDQPLILIITTAGFNKFSACYEFRNVATQVLEGKVKNDGLFAIIWTIDEGDDWESEEAWIKANPNYGNTPKAEQFRQGYQNAITEGGSALVEFKTKNLNIWVDAASVWISDNDWMNVVVDMDMDKLIGARCIIGVDLSSRVDLTAITYLFPDLGWFYIDYYCPEDKINGNKRVDGVDYRDWQASGYINVTDGNVIDYDFIIRDVLNNAELYRVEILTYDPHNADLIIPKFVDQGLNCIGFRQGFLSMNSPCKRLEMDILSGKLHHSGDPVTRWMMGNVEISTDPAGNIKMDKSKSSNKIDGPVSLATAIGGYLHIENNKPDMLSMADLERLFE
jgi:phage terminase large subunit-like protein